jgi:alkanesulfonate monooxygenase SsuD/methylene tetrahydromethanopterin reductase-like flavin-dependent oxidoreductase (luciferase family)
VEGSLRLRTVVDGRLEAKVGGDNAVQVSLDGSPAEMRARIGEYQAAGVGHLVVAFEADDRQAIVRDLRRFAAEVMTQVS